MPSTIEIALKEWREATEEQRITLRKNNPEVVAAIEKMEAIRQKIINRHNASKLNNNGS